MRGTTVICVFLVIHFDVDRNLIPVSSFERERESSDGPFEREREREYRCCIQAFSPSPVDAGLRTSATVAVLALCSLGVGEKALTSGQSPEHLVGIVLSALGWTPRL